MLGRERREDPLDHGDQVGTVRHPFPVGAEALLVGVDPDRGGEAAPQALGPHGDLDRHARGLEHPVRRDRGMVSTRDARHLAAEEPPGALEGVHPDHAGQQRRPDHAPDAGRVPLVQRGHDAVGEVHAGQEVGDGYADLGRLLGAGHRHQAALALRDLVVAGAVRLRPVVPEAGDAADHQARVELVEPLDGEAEAVEHADPEVLQQHVGAAYQRSEDLRVVGVLEVEDDRLLVAVGRHEVRRVLVVARVGRRPRAAPRPGCRRRWRSRP